MSERKQLTIWVSENQVNNWDSYQEELGFQNRAEMIRRAVEYFYSTKTGEGEGQAIAEDVLGELDSLQDKIDRTRADLGDIRREQISQDNIQDFAQETSYFLSKDLDSGIDDYRQVIRELAEDGVEYIRIDMDSIGFPDEVDEEFGDVSQVVSIEDVEDSSILRPLIGNIAQSEDDIEDQYGIEVLSEEEAVAYGV
ncbi:hypothetical protein [Halobacterium salinarum]|uniref:hypothetical protein n=1 Tax=Halobacterium salinarum TaxID=2242 RepID=UPI002555FFF2|nr:hypothetical protein [Halobacterium salinarum]MDL0145781.1 hypothetical protein [Halobacterium salinarum]